jgi:ABC-type Mn2+/Zn2+ transport system ATPase subunit
MTECARPLDGSSVIVVEAAEVSLGYGVRPVIKRVDFRIRMGEFWFLLGPNGTGKTTLLRGLFGLLRPQAGAFRFHPALGQRERLGFVPQGVPLNPSVPTTVREFILLGMVGIKAKRKEQSERVAQALEKVGLGGMERRDFWSLSEGQRQRALVARALARRPLLLVMDEPTNGLDVAAETALLGHVARLHREERLSVLFVSHHLATAARYGTHVALFCNQSIETGPAETILNPVNIERIYGIEVGNPFGGIATAVPSSRIPSVDHA